MLAAKNMRDREARKKFRAMAMQCHPDMGGSVAAFQALCEENEQAKLYTQTQDDIEVLIMAAAASWLLVFGVPHFDPLATITTLVGAIMLLPEGPKKEAEVPPPPRELAPPPTPQPPPFSNFFPQRPFFDDAVQHVSKGLDAIWSSATSYKTVWERRAEYAA